MAINDESVMSYFKVNFELIHEHGFTLSDIENMIPFERDIYLHLTNQWINKRNEAISRQKQKTG